MQVLKADEVFKNIKIIDKKTFENSGNIILDFSNVDNIDLKSIETLLNIQKVALLNKKSLSISNVNSKVENLLEVTGLNKTFANLATNPITLKKV